MGYVTALFAMPARMSRPTRGVHTSAYGYFRGLFAEMRRNRARRVRRYVEFLSPIADTGSGPEPTPSVPAPRRPVDALLGIPVSAPERDASAVTADLVRGYYREWEKKEATRSIGQGRLNVAILRRVIAEHGEAA